MKKNRILIALIAFSVTNIVKAQINVLMNFNLVNGESPNGSLTLSGNVLYGMVQGGGANGAGRVFSIHTDGSGYKDILDFNKTNGRYPYSDLTLSGSKLYGMTCEGGINDSGVIFSIDTNGSGYRDLLDFTLSKGSYPTGTLTLSGNILYGVTYLGGSKDSGCIFSIQTDGSGYKKLHDFHKNTGSYPTGKLVLMGNRLFGKTQFGGLYDSGCVYSIDTNGNGYKDLFDFKKYRDPTPALGSLIAVGNKLYGMTFYGGVYNDGIIFSIDTDGTGATDIYNFQEGYGDACPIGSLILSGNTLYGMTTGDFCIYVPGDIFSVHTDGTGFKNLAIFDRTNGKDPYGSLTVSGNMLYGMAIEGGTDNYGTVFSIDTNGTSSINNLTESSDAINLYPNPNNGIFTFSLVGAKNFVPAIEIYNVMGEKVLKQTLHFTEGDNRLDISSQPSGVYFYRVLNEDGGLIGEGKFVKQ